MNKSIEKELVSYLSNFVSAKRFELFKKNIDLRTRYITIALENIYQPHNASAVLRTCDCFGIQDVHIIENENEYLLNPDVALGSSKWLDLHRYNQTPNNTLQAVEHLKRNGYRIIATTPHSNDVNLEDFDISEGKIALFMGTEMDGVSDIVMNNADEFLKIPMYGFTESFNISVSAAIILHYLSHLMRKTEISWQLKDDEKNTIMLNWLRTTIKKPELIEQAFHEKRAKN